MIRFCDHCCQERTDTSWCDRYRKRFCMDCYNMLCEQIEAEEAPYEPERPCPPIKMQDGDCPF